MGQYNPTHPALLEWKQETRAQAKANPGDDDPLDWEVAWGEEASGVESSRSRLHQCLLAESFPRRGEPHQRTAVEGDGR